MIAARGCDDEADSGRVALVGDGWGTGASGSVSGAGAMAPGGCAQHGQAEEGERPFAAREGRLLEEAVERLRLPVWPTTLLRLQGLVHHFAHFSQAGAGD